MAQRPRDPGDLVYLSTRKLYGAAAYFGMSTAALAPAVGVSGAIKGQVGPAALGQLSAEASAQMVRTEPGWEERIVHQHLTAVTSRLGDLPDLERGDSVREGGWFRFHRNLKFGIAHADGDSSVSALVVVDREPAEQRSPLPALLMNGSAARVRDPYATEDLRTASGSRSGSGTTAMFIWLEEMRKAWEEDPTASLPEIRATISGGQRSGEVAMGLYRLFIRENWLDSRFATPVLHRAPCEGVAQASSIAVTPERVLVIGSPLYLRIKPLAGEPARSRGRLARFLHRDAQ